MPNNTMYKIHPCALATCLCKLYTLYTLPVTPLATRQTHTDPPICNQTTFQWRHNERHGVSYHRCHDYLGFTIVFKPSYVMCWLLLTPIDSYTNVNSDDLKMHLWKTVLTLNNQTMYDWKHELLNANWTRLYIHKNLHFILHVHRMLQILLSFSSICNL